MEDFMRNSGPLFKLFYVFFIHIALFPSSLSSYEMSTELKKLEVDFEKVNFEQILSSRFVTQLPFKNIEEMKLDIKSELNGGENDEALNGRLDFLDGLISEQFLEQTYADRYNRFLLHKFKPYAGGYSRLTISSSLEFAEGVTILKSDDEFKFCNQQLAELSDMFGKANAVRDLIPDTFQLHSLLVGSLDAQWFKGDFSIDFSCNMSFTRSNFRFSTASLRNPKKELVKEVQSALNFFGFSVGVADGIHGRKTRSGIATFQKCIKQIGAGDYVKGEVDFLLKSHDQLSKLKSNGNCDDLERLLPIKPVLVWAKLSLVPAESTKKINPIDWLICTAKSQRIELYGFEEFNETNEINSNSLYGVDFAEGKVFAENKMQFRENVKISDALIEFTNSFKSDDGTFDNVIIETSINRMSGEYSEIFVGSERGKETAKRTQTGSCELVSQKERKF